MSTPSQYNHHQTSLLDFPNELFHEIISHCIGDIDTLLQIPEIKSRMSNHVSYISNSSINKSLQNNYKSYDVVIAKLPEQSADRTVAILRNIPVHVSFYLLYEHVASFEVTKTVLEQLCKFKNVFVKVKSRSYLSRLSFTQMVRYLGLSKSTEINLQECFIDESDPDICEDTGCCYPWIHAARSSYSDPKLFQYLLKTCPNMIRCEVFDSVTSGDFTSFHLSNIRHDKLQYLDLSDLAKAESLDFPHLEELSISFPDADLELPEPLGIYKVSCPNLKSLTLNFDKKCPLIEDFDIGELDKVRVRGLYTKGQHQPSAKTMDFFSRFKTVESDGFLFCSLTINELFVNCETLYIREEEYYEDPADQFDKANAFPNVKNLIVHHVACFDNGMLGFPKLESLHLHLSWELLDSHWGKLIRSVKHLTFTADKHSQESIIPEHCDDMGSFGDSCLQTLTFEGYHFNPVPFLASVYNLKKVHTLSFIEFQGETDLQIDQTHTPNLSTLMVERSQGSTSFKLQLQSLEKLIHLKTSNVSKIYIERCHNLQTMKTFKPNDDFGMLRLEADSLPHLRQLSYMEATMIDIPDLNCNVDVQKMIRRSHKRGFEDD